MQSQKNGRRRAIIQDIVAVIMIMGIIFTVILSIKLRVQIAYIASGSMEPTYYKGDLIILEKVNAAQVKIGDVIVFLHPITKNIYILHRVVAKKFENGKYYFLTKGDNPDRNIAIDSWGWVSEDNLYGRLVQRIPYMGYLIEITQNPVIKVLLFLVILTTLILSFVSQREIKEIRRIKEFNYLPRKLGSLSALMIFIIIVGSLFISLAIITPGEFNVHLQESYLIHDTNTNITYLSICLSIKSEGFFFESIRKIILIARDPSNETLGEAVWSISYNFHGVKKVSIALLLNASIIPQSVLLDIKIFIKSITKVRIKELYDVPLSPREE